MKAFLQRFTRLTALIVFGLILPGCLGWTMLVSHFRMQRAQMTEDCFDQLSHHLDTLDNYHDDRVFFHGLFQKNFAVVDSQPGAMQRLAGRIAALRRLFPGKLKFIVYDQHGNVDRQLTDEKKFQYVLKAMYLVLRELQRLFNDNPAADPTSSELISERMQLLRGYFGPFLVQKFMLEPFQPEYRGRCLFVGEEPEKRLLWYYLGKDFALACFIDASILDTNIGPRMIIDRFNAAHEAIKLAYLAPLTQKSHGLPPGEEAEAEIRLEAGKFAGCAEPARESAHFLTHFRLSSPELLAISYMSNDELPVPVEAAKATLFIILRCLLVAGFVIYCASMRLRRFSLPVQQKIILLFLFANGLPLLMLASVGYEFFNEKKKDLITATHQESVRVLKEFDVRFPEVGASLSRRLNAFIDARNRSYESRKWPETEIRKLKELTASITPQEAVLYNNLGETVFRSSWSFNPSEKMVRGLLLKALEFFNSGGSLETVATRNVLDEVSSSDLMLHDFLWYMGRFVVLNTGDSGRLSFIRMLGGSDPGTGKFAAWGAFGISWDPAAFMRTFVVTKLQETSDAVAPRRILVFERSSENILALKAEKNRQIRHLFKQTLNRKLVTRENLEIDGVKYLFTSIVGSEITDGILGALYPQSLIEEKLENLKLTFWGAGFLIAVILFQVARFFAARLLVPVEELDKGIAHMRSRDFDYRIDYRSQDEFGELIATFKRTLEGMKELAVGTAVQESLLPPGRLSAGRLRLFARSLFMSKMGGDYYDYFQLPSGNLGIFFGDVAGHGIPAAMLMAMVKAVIAAAGSDEMHPQQLLVNANQVLLELKKRNWRRMMTAVCFDVDMQTGAFSFANAGHCYPGLVKPEGMGAVLIERSGMPLGSTSKKMPALYSGVLLPGETLVLYTDGIIESVGSAGEQFGYQRFTELLQSAWHSDLEVYWRNIIDGYRNWALCQDDDLTFLLLRLEENHD